MLYDSRDMLLRKGQDTIEVCRAEVRYLNKFFPTCELN